jgi:acyl-coenzyme A synthetase/AMP-(fatty) acid ligase
MNIFLNAQGISDWLKITEGDVFHVVLPLHHINSTTFCVSVLLAGGSLVLSSRYSKSKFWQIMANFGCTLTSIVPTICFDLLSEHDSFVKNQAKISPSLRIQIGSAPVQPSDALKFFELYQIPLVQGYGSTETALRVTGVSYQFLPLKDAADSNFKGAEAQHSSSKNSIAKYKKILASNTIGVELTWNNICVRKADGTLAGEGEEGEICIRGPILTKGYLKNDQANAEAFQDGWFHSGDVGFWRFVSEVLGESEGKAEDGAQEKLYFISGRQKEIIIKGGVNLSPLAIENAILKAFPEISHCHAVGFPDIRYGEEIMAVLCFRDDFPQSQQKKIINSIKNPSKDKLIAELSHYEHPKKVLVVKAESLPRTSTGKIQRVEIKKLVHAMSTPIAQTDNYLFRRLTTLESDATVSQLVEIHNHRWGEHLGISEATTREAIKNGLVIGAFRRIKSELSSQVERSSRLNDTQNTANSKLSDMSEALDGSIFAMQLNNNALREASDWEKMPDWLQNYDLLTNNLTLKKSNPENKNGDDVLLLVSVSVRGKTEFLKSEEVEKPKDYEELLQIAPTKIDDYLKSNQDPVITFHAQPKAGLKEGATILKTLANSRPADYEAMGYNVLMGYPEFLSQPKNKNHSGHDSDAQLDHPAVSADAGLGQQLVEAAIAYARTTGLSRAYAYSRPVGFREYLRDE